MFETLTLIAAWVGAASGLFATIFHIYLTLRDATKLVVEARDYGQGPAHVRVVNGGDPTVVVEEAGYVMPKHSDKKRHVLKPEAPKKGRLERGDHQDYIPHSEGVISYDVGIATAMPEKYRNSPVAYARTSTGRYFYSHGRLARWRRKLHKLE